MVGWVGAFLRARSCCRMVAFIWLTESMIRSVTKWVRGNVMDDKLLIVNEQRGLSVKGCDILQVMKIVLLTNLLSPHQMPQAKAMVECVGVEAYRYIFTDASLAERTKMGWGTAAVE